MRNAGLSCKWRIVAITFVCASERSEKSKLLKTPFELSRWRGCCIGGGGRGDYPSIRASVNTPEAKLQKLHFALQNGIDT
jgi:hypothetical protein